MKCTHCGMEGETVWRIDAPGFKGEYCSDECAVNFIKRIKREMHVDLSRWLEKQ